MPIKKNEEPLAKTIAKGHKMMAKSEYNYILLHRCKSTCAYNANLFTVPFWYQGLAEKYTTLASTCSLLAIYVALDIWPR